MRLTTWSLIFTVFNIGLAIGVVIAVGMLLYFQLRSILKNRTGIEDWIIDKAIYRRKSIMKAAKEAGDENYQVEPFVYPYDIGRRKNVIQVLNFSCLPIGDGVNWPVVDGCDQYTLTVIDNAFKLSLNLFKVFIDFQREQLLQKVDKRARTRRYRIISKATGSWMPLWSQGIKVCIRPPLTDEPRIALDVGDLVNVTRWRKFWLFGERIQEDPAPICIEGNGNKKQEKDSKLTIKTRTRGWFPRQCAVEFFEDNDSDSDDDFEEIKKKK